MIKVILSGANGFVGSRLLSQLEEHTDVEVLGLCRCKTIGGNTSKLFAVGTLEQADLSVLLPGRNVFIHTAARVHIMNDSSPDPLADFRAVNVEGTLNLARQAAQAGVKRFVFLSSISVNGTNNTLPYSVNDTVAPVESSGISKLEAEIGLRKIAAETGMEVVIIRPPLVYGPNAPGNFGKLAKLASKNLPLPFGAIHNKRSLVSLDNLADLIITCIDHPNAANQTFLVSDDHDVSTTELLNAMTLASGKQPRLIPISVYVLRLLGRLTGKLAIIDRLCGNLQVDISHTKSVLGWKPPVSFQDGIQKCFQKEQKND